MSADVFAMAMSLLELAIEEMSSKQDFRLLVWKIAIESAKQSVVESSLVGLFNGSLSERQAHLLAKGLCEQEGDDNGVWKRRITAKEFLTELRLMIDSGLW